MAPPLTNFGAAYKENLRKGPDQVAGVARANQNALDAGKGSKNIVRGEIIGSEWTDPELMTVCEPEIPIRKATSEENKQFAEEMGKPISIVGDVFAGGAVIAAATPGLQPVAPALATIGAAASATGGLIENGGAWAADHLGRLTVDMDRVQKRIQEPHDRYEGSSQDDPENMMH